MINLWKVLEFRKKSKKPRGTVQVQNNLPPLPSAKAKPAVLGRPDVQFISEYFDFCQKGTIATDEVMALCYGGIVDHVDGYNHYLKGVHHPSTNITITCLKEMIYEVQGYTTEECRVVRRFGRSTDPVIDGSLEHPFWVTSFTVEGTKKEEALKKVGYARYI